jgi:RecA-family ATPase
VQTGRRPEVVCLADVEPEDVDWLWQPYIPKGKLTILEGDPGAGKTWLALQLAAIITKGDPFPDAADGCLRARRAPGTVVYLSAEDGLADTLRPRLDSAGADPSKVYALTGWTSIDPKTGESTCGNVTLQDIDMLRQTMRTYNTSLVVVDPLQAYLGSDIDMHRANAVRPVLAGLANLAEEFKTAVLLIRHLGKSQQDRSIYRGLGSIDFVAAARSVYWPDRIHRTLIVEHSFRKKIAWLK